MFTRDFGAINAVTFSIDSLRSQTIFYPTWDKIGFSHRIILWKIARKEQTNRELFSCMPFCWASVAIKSRAYFFVFFIFWGIRKPSAIDYVTVKIWLETALLFELKGSWSALKFKCTDNGVLRECIKIMSSWKTTERPFNEMHTRFFSVGGHVALLNAI